MVGDKGFYYSKEFFSFSFYGQFLCEFFHSVSSLIFFCVFSPWYLFIFLALLSISNLFFVYVFLSSCPLSPISLSFHLIIVF
jgi:hypothetical protein